MASCGGRGRATGISAGTAAQCSGIAALSSRSHSARTMHSASSSTSAVKVSVVMLLTSFTMQAASRPLAFRR
ncbi:hypothetical protein A5772_18755 [Mycolicibacter sinensis]|uniref:Uncharacterized protein n=1 Tax=Mycolicibacter sinensis (strain JDM601) TaxID=875328 RepID=A0A1A2ETI6_MYCSD|nr:hypothetical protein A5771_16215 [Mycolicibacter sinensis]OBG08161.1 hypothetical protein A5772_18755 [Mycolicibacter sinensis]